MTMLSLYEEMKACLNFLGLRFCDMHQVRVTMDGNGLVFNLGRKKIHIGIPKR